MHNFNEDHEAVEVIACLDKRINLEISDISGKRALTIHKGFRSSHMYRIERFVKDIEQGCTDRALPPSTMTAEPNRSVFP